VDDGVGSGDALTVYRIFADGCGETIVPMFGPRLGFLVSDRATVFGFWAMALRQVCHAHPLLKYVAFSERDGPTASIGRELLELTSLLFEYWHGFKEGHLTRQELQFWMRPVQRDVEHALERGAAADIERLSGSCADILAHREGLWTFVEHDGVEPTNNHAELELRDFVLWRKRSFGSQSERGERFAERVITAVRTARRQGACIGPAWRPRSVKRGHRDRGGVRGRIAPADPQRPACRRAQARQGSATPKPCGFKPLTRLPRGSRGLGRGPRGNLGRPLHRGPI
jgi:hypothetical protein